MKYPNAYKGVSQIYKAELIAILAVVCTGIGAILAIFGVGVADVGSQVVGAGFAISGALFVIATAVLMIISYILNIIGVGNASKDEQGFKSALIAIIIGIIGSIVAAIFTKNEVVVLIGQLISQICDILVFWFCIGGIRNLAERLRNRAIEDKANSFIKLVVGIYAVGILLGVIAGLVKFGDFMNGLVNVASVVCSIVAYLSYLSLLRGAQNMLAR